MSRIISIAVCAAVRRCQLGDGHTQQCAAESHLLEQDRYQVLIKD